MTTDTTLCDRLLAVARDRMTTLETRETVERAVEGYRVACSISRMPNKSRAARWHVIACQREKGLLKLYERVTGDEYAGTCA